MGVIQAIKQHAPANDQRCKRCGSVLPARAMFCGRCGERLLQKNATLSTTRSWQLALSVALPISALVVWFLSLKLVDVARMDDLGLVSVLPPSIYLSFVLLTVSFFLTLWHPKFRAPIMLLHFVLLIVMLYAITNVVEQAPRFSIVYRHEGYTEYIMRTGRVAPDLDAYFNWPGFFVLSAFVARVSGYQDILPFATWSSVFLNLIYMGPLYILFRSATTEKRVVWLALWFFFLTNWIAQDYYSPQGFDFFMYLVIIAVLLKWFKLPAPGVPRILSLLWREPAERPPIARWLSRWFVEPDYNITPTTRRQRMLLLVVIIAIFAFVVCSHPLTPFSVIATVCALVIFQRCTPRWLPLLLIAMTALWIVTMTQTYLAGHLGGLLGEVGNLRSAISDNLTHRVEQGDPQHTFITQFRLLMTLFVWGLACIGAIVRLRSGPRDLTFVLLALAPFPLLLTQSYGGELLLRIYLFTLPPMVFFAASLFYSSFYNVNRNITPWLRTALLITTLVLLGGFFFTRYGNERMDYMTNNEVAGVHYLYHIAPNNSLLISPWDGPPWQIAKYEQYSTFTMSEEVSYTSDLIVHKNVGFVIHLIQSAHPSRAYVIFTRSEFASAQTSGLPPYALNAFKLALISSGQFALIYSNPDAQILVFIPGG
jgi:ribosomal protein L40E